MKLPSLEESAGQPSLLHLLALVKHHWRKQVSGNHSLEISHSAQGDLSELGPDHRGLDKVAATQPCTGLSLQLLAFPGIGADRSPGSGESRAEMDAGQELHIAAKSPFRSLSETREPHMEQGGGGTGCP